eukprot:TRINITY_DN12129_c1_g1_i1.p1 TRINITY_DN12129_c1_g1~~TRINITY_DN12129_c1_g1_i1.p1  ORF type:complete len:657 (+),score=95.48 TRINITY_DN12129_c1_g1_i1:166-2136(+)
MAKDPPISAKDAIYKLQLSLLGGIRHENQLFAAGTLISRSDYEDVVTERSISNLCGYPLCANPLPSDRPRKGRYRISLKEHKVYDLSETHMYCSRRCVVNSRAFAASLQSERCSVTDSAKIAEVLRLVGDSCLDEDKEGLGKNGELGFSNLRIEEKLDVKVGEVSLEDWIGPSNAIEGYVPRPRDHKPSEHYVEGSEPKLVGAKREKGIIGSETDFTSTIVMGDHIIIPETSRGFKQKSSGSEPRVKKLQGEAHVEKETDFTSTIIMGDQIIIPETSRGLKQNSSGSEPRVKTLQGETHVEKKSGLKETMLKSSLKSSGPKTLTRNVTWADERKIENPGDGILCDYHEIGDNSESIERSEVSLKESERSGISNREDVESSLRVASAEAVAIALREAAEAVASGESDVMDAVCEVGLVILPHSNNITEENSTKIMDELEAEECSLKWPKKPTFLDSNIFDSEDSWHDTPPEGFSLTLSSFATMWMALFGWMTTSSLAYIYGRDESSRDDYLFVNGREYPHKIFLSDGRSSEIKNTLAGCIARALPGLVTDLRLPTPVSTLEQAMGRLLDTLSFVDALPPFKMKQWHMIILLFIDALSVHRLPVLTLHMTNRRTLLHKVLDGAQISGEEYEAMKDLIIPLGRTPPILCAKWGLMKAEM